MENVPLQHFHKSVSVSALPGSSSRRRNESRRHLQTTETKTLCRVNLGEPLFGEVSGFGFSIRGGTEYGFGVFVSNVDVGGLAEQHGLQTGDLIVDVNNISFKNVKHTEAAKIISAARCLELLVSRTGRIPDPQSRYSTYVWLDREGHTVSPPLDDDPRSDDLDLTTGTLSLSERKVNVVVGEGGSLGLMIRGGSDFGLGVYVTGVDRYSQSHEAGLKVGDQILDVNGHSFLSILHTEAAHILRSSTHMIMSVRDVGKIPYAKTSVDKIKWLDVHQHVPPTFNFHRHGRDEEEINGEYKSAFSRGAGSQLMFNSFKSPNKKVDGQPKHSPNSEASPKQLEKKSLHLLNVPEQEKLRFYMTQYQQHQISTEEFLAALRRILNTRAKKMSLDTVSPELLTKWRALYHFYDVDGDGILTKNDFKLIEQRIKNNNALTCKMKQELYDLSRELWGALIGENLDKPNIEGDFLAKLCKLYNNVMKTVVYEYRVSLFKAMDKEATGFINFTAFKVLSDITGWMGVENNPNSKDQLELAFEKIDVECTGRITMDQYTSAYVGYVTDPQVKLGDMPLFGFPSDGLKEHSLCVSTNW